MYWTLEFCRNWICDHFENNITLTLLRTSVLAIFQRCIFFPTKIFLFLFLTEVLQKEVTSTWHTTWQLHPYISLINFLAIPISCNLASIFVWNTTLLSNNNVNPTTRLHVGDHSEVTFFYTHCCHRKCVCSENVHWGAVHSVILNSIARKLSNTIQ